VGRNHNEDIAMKTFAMFGVMLLAAGPAFAQTASTGPTPTGSNPGGPAPKAAHAAATKAPSMEARMEQRIVQMHQRLKITPAQQVMRENVTSIDQAYTTRRTTVATMSAPDNMRNFAQIEQDRAAGIQKLAATFQTLYDGMSDEQKQTADAMFRNYGERGARAKKAAK
jgi:protein CpxP